MSEWQPISTAPKDGTEFIGFGICLGDYGYTKDEKTWTGCHWNSYSSRFENTKANPRYVTGWTFTHWMPLPEPPKS